MAALAPYSSAFLSKDPFLTEKSTTFSGCKGGKGGTQQTQTVEELKGEIESLVQMESGSDLFDEIKHRFLSFRKQKYMENLEQYQNLASVKRQRVCPSCILGFEPGEAFVVRNVANMVLPFEGGPSETKAALEFAVENILVIGHSCCGGIRALMSMQDGEDSSGFTGRWVVVGRKARLNTEVAASNLGFDQQWRHCEKEFSLPLSLFPIIVFCIQESVNCSLLNLLTYPWIEEKVRKGQLSVNGGYYDFVECTLEKWTLDYNGGKTDESNRVAVKNQSFWR
ncbi:hypothetical protein SLE2022_155220 [Rubroshorea leprosula]